MTRPLDCLIISTGRAASTAVYRYLNEMGGLALPQNKEPHYWCTIERYGDLYPLIKRITLNDITEYESIYASSNLMIDASVGYFFSIDEVLERLSSNGQRPKIIFLYREPLSRADSLFNELKKKGMEKHSSIELAVQKVSEPNLWWEHYYDNVAYADVLRKLIDSGLPLTAINYDSFKEAPAEVMNKLCEFLGVKILKSISFQPVNSSAEARFLLYSQRVGLLRRFIPSSWKLRIISHLDQLRNHRSTDFSRLKPHLSFSIAQFSELKAMTAGKGLFQTEPVESEQDNK